ncbi:MAG: DUF3363 domain-containing protein, partial [Rhodospirillales bacterium]|nr:DUF3363 domain-containing protein [Rhodospirillales bacterium]
QRTTRSSALQKDISAERWTGFDRRLQRLQDDTGHVDLRPDLAGRASPDRAHLLGRMAKLERLGLAEPVGVARWTLASDLETTLRDLSERGDIIKTMHKAMTRGAGFADPGRFALHDHAPSDPVIGRLVERGLHDEIAGDAYAIVDGIDGRVYHLKFADLDLTGDAEHGAIVELRTWEDDRGNSRRSLAVRSDLSLDRQITATGATWLDRQLVAAEPLMTGGGFGAEVEAAKIERAEHLAAEGMGRRQGNRILLARGLLGTLQTRELDQAVETIARRTGLDHAACEEGDWIKGVYRERIKLASGRFAMIQNELGFELVPWKPSLDRHLGESISGAVKAGGGIEWSIGRKRGIEI